jgi:hypothetical protein
LAKTGLGLAVLYFWSLWALGSGLAVATSWRNESLVGHISTLTISIGPVVLACIALALALRLKSRKLYWTSVAIFGGLALALLALMWSGLLSRAFLSAPVGRLA